MIDWKYNQTIETGVELICNLNMYDNIFILNSCKLALNGHIYYYTDPFYRNVKFVCKNGAYLELKSIYELRFVV